MTAGRNHEAGVVLINVLAVVALASTVVFVMLTAQTGAIRRSQQFGDAAQAHSIALGAVESAVAVLRRDKAAGERIDHAGEPWGALAEQDAPIDGGTFTLRITDAQGRYNVNSLGRGLAAAQIFERIAQIVGVPADQAQRIALGIVEGGPVRDLRELADIGIDAEAIERLSLLVTALPGRTDVNINAADEALIAIMLRNPVAASSLVRQRARAGFVTQKDIQQARVLLPAGIGLESDHFTVDVTVRVGDTAQRVQALIARRKGTEGVLVSTLSLKREAAAP